MTLITTEENFSDFKQANIYCQNLIKNYDVVFCVKDISHKPIMKEEYADGYDIGITQDYILEKLECHKKLSTGIKTYIANGLKINLLPRSSSYDKYYGLMLANQVGVIDPSYRGEILANCVFMKGSVFKDLPLYNINPDTNTRNDYFQLIIGYSLTHNHYFDKRRPLKICVLVSSFVYDNWNKLLPTGRDIGGFGSTDAKKG